MSGRGSIQENPGLWKVGRGDSHAKYGWIVRGTSAHGRRSSHKSHSTAFGPASVPWARASPSSYAAASPGCRRRSFVPDSRAADRSSSTPPRGTAAPGYRQGAPSRAPRAPADPQSVFATPGPGVHRRGDPTTGSRISGRRRKRPRPRYDDALTATSIHSRGRQHRQSTYGFLPVGPARDHSSRADATGIGAGRYQLTLLRTGEFTGAAGPCRAGGGRWWMRFHADARAAPHRIHVTGTGLRIPPACAGACRPSRWKVVALNVLPGRLDLPIVNLQIPERACIELC